MPCSIEGLCTEAAFFVLICSLFTWRRELNAHSSIVCVRVFSDIECTCIYIYIWVCVCLPESLWTSAFSAEGETTTTVFAHTNIETKWWHCPVDTHAHTHTQYGFSITTHLGISFLCTRAYNSRTIHCHLSCIFVTESISIYAISSIAFENRHYPLAFNYLDNLHTHTNTHNLLEPVYANSGAKKYIQLLCSLNWINADFLHANAIWLCAHQTRVNYLYAIPKKSMFIATNVYC